MNASPPPTKRRFGCLGYGCIVAVILFFLVVGGLVWGGRFALRNAVELFTTDVPAAVPTLPGDEAAQRAALEKVANLRGVVRDPKGAGEFSLSQRDILELLSTTVFNKSVFPEIQGDSLVLTFSFPLTALGEWGSARWIIADKLNRYLSGTSRVKALIDNGVVAVTVEDLTLNGQVFDGDSLKEATEYISGFVTSLKDDQTARGFLDRIGSLRIQNGEALVRIRPE